MRKITLLKLNNCINTENNIIAAENVVAILPVIDKEGKEIVNITKEYNQYYVPYFLSLEDEGYGDYVYLNINGDGTIEHFERMKNMIKIP